MKKKIIIDVTTKNAMKIDSRDLNVRTNDNVERDTLMIWKRKKLTKKNIFTYSGFHFVSSLLKKVVKHSKRDCQCEKKIVPRYDKRKIDCNPVLHIPT